MSTFNPNGMHDAVSLTQSRSLQGSGTVTHSPLVGAAENFGVEGQTAWATGGRLRSLNARNRGSFMRFDQGPSYAPVEMR